MAKKDYVQANRDWLAAKATEEGVKPLPGGIYSKKSKQFLKKARICE